MSRYLVTTTMNTYTTRRRSVLSQNFTVKIVVEISKHLIPPKEIFKETRCSGCLPILKYAGGGNIFVILFYTVE